MNPDHAQGCALDPIHWLRRAIVAAGRRVSPEDDQVHHVDWRSAIALTDTLAQSADLEDWADVTLLEVARRAALTDQERFGRSCTCRGRLYAAPKARLTDSDIAATG